MLVLLDIDGTLLTGDGVGMRALAAGGRDAFGRELRAEGVTYSGRLDPLIVTDLLRLNGIEESEANRAALRGAYTARLELDLQERPVRALGGAMGFVEALIAAEGVTVGLLTGNFRETGEMKLRSAGFSLEAFAVRVWGDESPEDPPHRDHLPAVAVERYAALRGESIGGERVVVVGDTPGDVGCARAGGHRSIAVTTGRFDAGALAESGADLVVDGLGASDELAAWIVGGVEPRTGVVR